MLIPLREIKRAVKIVPKSILHVGGHLAEESSEYERLFTGATITWIESQSELVDAMRDILKPERNEVICATVWNETGVEKEFYFSNNSQASSLLKFDQHLSIFPEILISKVEKVKTIRLDELETKFTNFDFVNLDIQGSELQALEGMGTLIEKVNYIYIEVNRAPIYIDVPQLKAIDKWLKKAGFERVAIRWAHHQDWGDAFYVKRATHGVIFVLKNRIRFQIITILRLFSYSLILRTSNFRKHLKCYRRKLE
jgi:FkbM family methyltransferase